MARANVFSQALQASVASADEPKADAEVKKVNQAKAEPQPTLGGAGKSVAEKDDVKSLDPFSIRMSPLQDRIDLEENPEQTIDQLASSIAEHGQHVPVLVRPIADGPDRGGHYEIVYGRRRLLACQKINQPVLARVRRLDDERALIAQIEENSARLDTSFIERALFVHSIASAGFKSGKVTKATGLDATTISRMKKVVSILDGEPFEGLDIIKRVGPAHGSGRRPWEQFANLVKGSAKKDVATALDRLSAPTSDERLQQAIGLLAMPTSKSEPEELQLRRGSIFVKTGKRATTLMIKENNSFAEFITSKIDDLYREWEAKQ